MKKNNVIILLFLSCASILNYNYSSTPLVYYSVFALILFLLLSYIYLRLYYSKQLAYSMTSYICFMVNGSILISYVLVIARVFFIGILEPVLIENISSLSHYKYLCFTVLAFIGVVVFFLAKLNTKLSGVLHNLALNIPSLKEETRLILHAYFNETWLGELCVVIVDKLHKNKNFRYFFFGSHFCLFFLLRAVRLSLFVNFCFFHGDLRYVLFLVPFGLLSWILGFIYYYLVWFIEANWIYLNDIFYTEVKTTVPVNNIDLVTIKSFNDIKLTLTPFAFSEGFTTHTLPSLKVKFIVLGNVTGLFRLYKERCILLNYIFLLCQIICWLNIITFYFFPTHYISISMAGINFWAIFRRPFINANSIPLRARDARFLKEEHMKELIEKTKGAYGAGHPAYGEEKSDGSYVAEGQLTHGEGSKNHPSKELDHTNMPSSKKSTPQNHRPFPEPVKLPKSNFHPPIKGSEQYLAQDRIKHKLDNSAPSLPKNKDE